MRAAALLAALLALAACGIKAAPEAPEGAYRAAPAIPTPSDNAPVSN